MGGQVLLPRRHALLGAQRGIGGRLNPGLQARAVAAKGFLPAEEGLALYRAAVAAAETVPAAPLVEIGSWCGKSALYLGAAAAACHILLFAVDHHRGSEEQQPGWEWHDPSLVDPDIGVLDTLPTFRRTVRSAGLEATVVAVVGESAAVARHWRTPCALVFIDGGHGRAPAHADYDGWAPQVAERGLLAIHDVFPDPAGGGRPPYEIFRRALDDGFVEVAATGSLRVLRRPSRSPPLDGHQGVLLDGVAASLTDVPAREGYEESESEEVAPVRSAQRSDALGRQVGAFDSRRC